MEGLLCSVTKELRFSCNPLVLHGVWRTTSMQGMVNFPQSPWAPPMCQKCVMPQRSS